MDRTVLRLYHQECGNSKSYDIMQCMRSGLFLRSIDEQQEIVTDQDDSEQYRPRLVDRMSSREAGNRKIRKLKALRLGVLYTKASRPSASR